MKVGDKDFYRLFRELRQNKGMNQKAYAFALGISHYVILGTIRRSNSNAFLPLSLRHAQTSKLVCPVDSHICPRINDFAKREEMFE